MSAERTQPASHADLASIREGDEGIVYAELRRVREGTTRHGRPFLDLELGDTTATLGAKVWSEAEARTMEAARALAPPIAVKVRFQARAHRENLELVVQEIRAAREEEFDPEVVVGRPCPAAEGLAARLLVVDIETAAACNIRDLPQTVVEAVARMAEHEEADIEKVTALSPLLSRVVSLAVGDAEGEGGSVLFVPPSSKDLPSPPPWLRVVTERELLEAFWELAVRAEVVVTYNGRTFDLPFLQVRSAIHGVPVRRDLLWERRSLRPHLDLRWLLTGGERGTGPFNLDTVCHAFGIQSPKGTMDGSMVGKAYLAGRFEEIARYNLADVEATRALFRKLEGPLLRSRRDWRR